MVELEQYRQKIQKLLQDYADLDDSDPEVETETIFDTVRDHYQLVHVGWQDDRRIYGCSLHLDIKDGKIWLQQNTTDIDVGQELIEMGVPKEDIVLGLHPTYKRPYTGYGVA
jgi:hypothetical protein